MCRLVFRRSALLVNFPYGKISPDSNDLIYIFYFVYFIITTDLYIFLYAECSQQITGSRVRLINHINSPTPTNQFNQFNHYYYFLFQSSQLLRIYDTLFAINNTQI